ncbi:hypothetical protein CQ12_07700 [Bradyrhizobium jicamae]|uniref:Uncharacterized protein n=1 Tax=Bradyrhizobium jicamae TaxID=280332 RepID=A0A0R3M5F5_9BRAD|nr:hypothetical protein CQ12_07700 [Bradyrhizobium jicamae]
MARAARQRLRPFQTNPTCGVSLKIEPADVRQDFLIAVTRCEFAETAGPVVDTEVKIVAGAGLDEIVDEIFRVFFRVAFRRLLTQQCLVLRRHELTP